ncbi:MAG: trypsin-like peptidase domain-containing protein [Candidatus Aminicenantes bacterium]|nr:MAG: trypsin-like peptidase domain-containing protein [Candidatus Aminicenantes bacterium]
MGYQEKFPFELPVEELDRELIARGAQIPDEKRFKFADREGTPEREKIMKQVKQLYKEAALSPNKELSHISTEELVRTLIFKTREMDNERAIWILDDRKDIYEIDDEDIKRSTDCVVAICMKDDLIDKKRGLSALKVKNYGKVFNLCDSEPYRDQPISIGEVCSGFLVKDDIIATAGHCANENNVKNLRIVFGFKMSDYCTAVTQVPRENIYEGVEIIQRVYSGLDKEPDWALVKLDRKVEGHEPAKLSRNDIYQGLPVYVIGHPAGLPLKVAPGAHVCDISDSCFVADLDIYSGNSGSPVFCRQTHEVIGIVARGDNRDFRWTGKGWVSVIYPNFELFSKGAQCTRVSEFIDIIDNS